MNLYVITYLDDLLEKNEKILLMKSEDLAKLEKFGNEYAKQNDVVDFVWELRGLPTVGDHEIPKDTIQKQVLRISEKEYLLIDE